MPKYAVYFTRTVEEVYRVEIDAADPVTAEAEMWRLYDDDAETFEDRYEWDSDSVSRHVEVKLIEEGKETSA